MLCSDGLSGYLDAKALAKLCKEYPDETEFCEKLIAEANSLGGSDNITAVVAKLK